MSNLLKNATAIVMARLKLEGHLELPRMAASALVKTLRDLNDHDDARVQKWYNDYDGTKAGWKAGEGSSVELSSKGEQVKSFKDFKKMIQQIEGSKLLTNTTLASGLVDSRNKLQFYQGFLVAMTSAHAKALSAKGISCVRVQDDYQIWFCYVPKQAAAPIRLPKKKAAQGAVRRMSDVDLSGVRSELSRWMRDFASDDPEFEMYGGRGEFLATKAPSFSSASDMIRAIKNANNLTYMGPARLTAGRGTTNEVMRFGRGIVVAMSSFDAKGLAARGISCVRIDDKYHVWFCYVPHMKK
jgi:hypothetical protein